MKPSAPGGNRRGRPHVGPEAGPALIALGYVRRNKESGARTVSLEDQRARIEAYCQERGWRLTEVLADDGVSGGRRERLERLAERVTTTHARVIVVYPLDRFERDLAATLDYLRRFSRRGVELHVVGRGQVEADTATGFIVTAVEGLAAEGTTGPSSQRKPGMPSPGSMRRPAGSVASLATASGWPPD